jgi:molecular chaperone GrpE
MSSKKTPESHPEHKAGKKPHPIPVEEGTSGSELEAETSNGEEMLESNPLIEELTNSLAKAEAQAAEFKDGWQRALADFQNYKRRTDAEKAEAYQNAVGTVVRRYLPILDDLERALAARPADLPWVSGIELIYRKLQTILDNEGLKRIEAEGQLFDPNFHEAVAQELVEGVESGTVIDVIQQGYMLGERVIRPAQVRVAQ